MSVKQQLEHDFPGLYKNLAEKKYFLDYRKNRRLVENESPEVLIRRLYRKRFGKEPNLGNPQTFNEKLQWLKLYWYDERMIICSNKALARNYVVQKGLGDTLIPQYGIYDSPDKVDFDRLPDSFVMKTSHDSGHVLICKDKKIFDIQSAKKRLAAWLAVDYEFKSGEWSYHTKKCIVCEKLMEDQKAGELFDYKFFCFNGKPKYVFFVSDRAHHAKSDFYDMEWNKQGFRWYYEPSGKLFPKPSTFDDMKKYAETLSEGFPFVRVDFYEIEGKIYFGELTFFHGGGLGWFKPESVDYEMGKLIELPSKSNPSPWEVVHPELKKRWQK